MKTLKTLVLRYLESQTLFRERKNKDRGIVNLLLERHPNIGKMVREYGLNKEELISFVREHSAMDRSWRQILEHTPELRGSDYDEKTKLESEKLEELGYATTKHI